MGPEGRLLAEASCDTPINRPQPVWAEIDPGLWWSAAVQTVREVLAKSGVDPHTIGGIGVDGISWSLVPVDAAFQPIAPAMIWLDRRAEAENRELQTRPDAAGLVAMSANPLDPAYITPKLLWLKHCQPAVFDQARWFLTSSGYLTARLTGEATCDFTQAYGYHFFDIAHERWDSATAGLLGIPLEKMPRLCACSDVAGTLSARAGTEMGLPAGIPVIAGCLDAASGALGAGVTRLGQTNEQGGQAGGMAISLPNVVVEPRLIFSHHVLQGQYLLQGGTVGGGSLGWFRDTLGQVEVDAAALLGQSAFELFNTQVEKAAPGAHGLIFVPYMAGERTPLWSSTARGIYFGLSYNTSRADMLRAIMEGCAFSVYHNMKVAEEKGAVVQECLGSGGATRSAPWCQIKADIYGKPFVVARTADDSEGGHLLGLLALTAYGAGLAADPGQMVERLLPNRRVFEPSMQRHALYEDLFGVYIDLVGSVMNTYERLDGVMKKHI